MPSSAGAYGLAQSGEGLPICTIEGLEIRESRRVRLHAPGIKRPNPFNYTCIEIHTDRQLDRDG